MAYGEKLADRLCRALSRRGGISEKKMFGGLAFLLGGKILCGIVKDDLMVRVGPRRYSEALGRPHVRPLDFTGRPMRGFRGPSGARHSPSFKAISARQLQALVRRRTNERGSSTNTSPKARCARPVTWRGRVAS